VLARFEEQIIAGNEISGGKEGMHLRHILGVKSHLESLKIVWNSTFWLMRQAR
jgi:hypothetical protein